MPTCFTAVLGRPTRPGVPAIVATGDSIADGAGDIAGRSEPSQQGFVSRASFSARQDAPVPMLNMARGGSRVGTGGGAATLARRSAYFRFADVAIDEYGSNDINSKGLGDVAALQAGERTLWRAMRGAGVGTILRTALIPRVRETADGWATLAGQVPNPAFATKAQAFDRWLADRARDGAIDGVVPMRSARAGGRAGWWLWPATGAAGYATADGTHPSTAVHGAMAAELRAAIAARFPAVDGGR